MVDIVRACLRSFLSPPWGARATCVVVCSACAPQRPPSAPSARPPAGRLLPGRARAPRGPPRSTAGGIWLLLRLPRRQPRERSLLLAGCRRTLPSTARACAHPLGLVPARCSPGLRAWPRGRARAPATPTLGCARTHRPKPPRPFAPLEHRPRSRARPSARAI
ncbi:MAG: hypothetical protein J3K34DRAFT_437024 [Monoraphidium minutum]|nr:MAG: hypothetical protein J3K34DRAFT_437024 [Monoraphidium minutum]